MSPEREPVSHAESGEHAHTSSHSHLAITQASQWKAGELRWFFLFWSQIHKGLGEILQGSACPRCLGLRFCPHLRWLCEMVMRYVCVRRLGVGSAVTASAPARRRRGRGRGQTRKPRDTLETIPQPAPNKVTCGKNTLPSSLSFSLCLSFRLSFKPFRLCPHSSLGHSL